MLSAVFQHPAHLCQRSTLLIMKRLYTLALLAFFVGVQIKTAFASDVEKELKRQYEKQVLALRSPVRGTHLEFDSSGKPLDSSQDSWTVHGAIYIERISIGPDRLHMEGPIVALGNENKKGKPEIIPLGKPIRVEIHLDHPATSADDLRALLDSVFFLDEKDREHAVPDFRRADFVDTSEPAYRFKGANKDGVTAPVGTHTPEPEFTEESRRQGLRHGTVMLETLVDKSGTVARIRIVRAQGMGLDQQAVEAVKTWRFQPARRNGEPIAILINIEVSFDRN